MRSVSILQKEKPNALIRLECEKPMSAVEARVPKEYPAGKATRTRLLSSVPASRGCHEFAGEAPLRNRDPKGREHDPR